MPRCTAHPQEVASDVFDWCPFPEEAAVDTLLSTNESGVLHAEQLVVEGLGGEGT